MITLKLKVFPSKIGLSYYSNSIDFKDAKKLFKMATKCRKAKLGIDNDRSDKILTNHRWSTMAEEYFFSDLDHKLHFISPKGRILIGCTALTYRQMERALK